MKTATTAFLFFMLFCLHSFSAEKPESGVVVISTSSDSAAGNAAEPIAQEDALLYDASELPVSKAESLVRGDLLKNVPEQYRSYVADFSDEELDTFLKKKSVYIENLIAAMKKIKLPEQKIEKFVESIDVQFYKSSRLVLLANSTGGQYKFLIRTGLSLNTSFLSKFKISKSRLVQYLSSKKGYFYLFAGGIGLSRVVDPETHKAHLILDLMVTREDLKSVTSLIAELVTIDVLVLGLSLDVRKGDFNSLFFDRGKIDYTASYLGPAGRLGRDSSRLNFEFPFSVPFVTSIALPPIASGLAIFESNATVYRYSLNLTQLNPKEIAGKLWSLVTRFGRQSSECSAFYTR